MARSEKVENVKSAPVYPVAEIVEQASELFNVPNYIATAALQDIQEIDIATAEKKIKALLKKEVE
ncbi:hypothetical protein OCD90_26035 [Bacillus pacificus]|uniref:hypothetical protein n=1 Tax=Bacillus TaxID=1386 RepID=UPI000945DC54|nr:hypothetical protein [Bacillus pacificus]MPU16812.1 hypothetical protein [Acinetobacter baumannii]MCC2419299.1 hypothetical protein [Bacillus pacificus]MCU5005764.1 hypothetical protein [Bacillus pacificus]MCU5259204.1 hypothetical protein [Bacillus pacificus]MCU5561978.1 hypothetical protein [Bacillus pacificus]